jgi:hypothetical protein
LQLLKSRAMRSWTVTLRNFSDNKSLEMIINTPSEQITISILLSFLLEWVKNSSLGRTISTQHSTTDLIIALNTNEPEALDYA